jgi:predicted RNase H-like HicB family nuclease
MNFPIVLHKDPDSDYGVTVPDLPGCFSAGSTIEEAFAMAREAIELYVETLVQEGREIPDASPIESLRSNADYADGIWAIISAEYPAKTPSQPVTAAS